MTEDKAEDASEMESLDLCRLCDQSGEKLFGIFDENEDGYEIIRLIKENLPIVIYKSDPLSKQICETCVETLQTLSVFKRTCRKTQEKYVEELKSEGDVTNKDVQLYLGCTGNKMGDNDDDDEEEEELKDKSTSTDDLTVLCRNCKQSILDASTVNGEIELCSDLHKAIAESLRKNKVATVDSESEKVLRKRKIQPLYHELDDSLCSSLTEFTRNTEDDNASQYGFDMHSDMESEESGEERPVKRRKVEREAPAEGRKYHEAKTVPNVAIEEKKDPPAVDPEEERAKFEKLFEDEPECTFEPLTLLELTLNVINVQNVPDYVPQHFVEVSSICSCNHCGQNFENMKLLALHEPTHMDVEVEEKIDNPIPWPDTHPEAAVRNKWLTYFDENGYDEEDIVLDVEADVEPEAEDEPEQEAEAEAEQSQEEPSLLTPKTNPTWDGTKPDQIVLVEMKPMVNGVYLGDYTKEERKAFYQCMRVGGQTKRFCTLCRYCFKDNWAIESHYFSLACHYTCRYCGMRFNKQRHKYEEHIKEHSSKNHPFSDKIYTASKVSNFVPKVIQPEKVKRIVPGLPETPRELKMEDYEVPSPIGNQNQMVTRRFERRSLQANMPPGLLIPKEEPKDFVSSQSKTGNQAYFCRKCYKVFFKLDEFNIHNRNCDYNQYPQNSFRTIQFNTNLNPRLSGPGSQVKASPNGNERRNGDLSNTGRPVRNCVKDIGTYKDDLYIPKEMLRDAIITNGQQNFICHICGTPFPTVYSRNSHMRIHKGEVPANMMQPPPLHPSLAIRPASQPKPPVLQPQQQHPMNYPRFDDIKIKEEPMDSFEPMVEIHEEEQPANQTFAPPAREIGGGAVSITPISKNPNQKPTINPNVMKLVQNNPNITIHKKAPEPRPSPAQSSGSGGFAAGSGGFGYNANPGSYANYSSFGNGPQMMAVDADKSYKCSSCWEAFSNKSHLYFHKKNQCEGSRFPCPFCKKRFGSEAAYSSHIFYSHPE